ncbi:MAG: FadR family transcriptional regulator [Chloroflexi bacterium]|nr:FadR family transcriptional regulator [Chloroflexota bacterium]
MSLTRECLKSIREYIVSNGLSSGDKLPSQQEWAEMLGVSVLVVREAFQSAQALGLVEVQHGRGIFVRGPEEADFLDFLAFGRPLQDFDLAEVIEARAMLELAVLESCIARVTPELVVELDALLDQMRAHPPRPGELSSVHRSFHQAMLTACGNRLLCDIGMPLINTFWALGNSGYVQFTETTLQTDLVGLHVGYMDAIKNRDLSHTRELVDEHLYGLCSQYGVFPCANGFAEDGSGLAQKG